MMLALFILCLIGFVFIISKDKDPWTIKLKEFNPERIHKVNSSLYINTKKPKSKRPEQPKGQGI
jgi:hypothetical protein